MGQEPDLGSGGPYDSRPLSPPAPARPSWPFLWCWTPALHGELVGTDPHLPSLPSAAWPPQGPLGTHSPSAGAEWCYSPEPQLVVRAPRAWCRWAREVLGVLTVSGRWYCWQGHPRSEEAALQGTASPESAKLRTGASLSWTWRPWAGCWARCCFWLSLPSSSWSTSTTANSSSVAPGKIW